MQPQTKPLAVNTLRNVNIPALLKQFCGLPLWRHTFARVGVPELKVRWGNKPREFVSGHCRYGARATADGVPAARSSICITISKYSRPADLAETLLHEVVHAAGYQHHRTSFYRALRKASEEAYGIAVDNVFQDRVYKYDRLLVERLHDLMGMSIDKLPSKHTRAVAAPTLVAAQRPVKPAPKRGMSLDSLERLINGL